MRDHFAKIMGAENALDNENDLLAYSYDASGMQGKARIVLFPKTDEHVRHIMTYANRTNIPVVPRGLGGNPNGMVVPDSSIVIDMKNFDRIHTVNLKEEWVHVDAGVVLSDLQRALAKYDYEFCINPQSARVATVGALLAMNQMDRRSFKYGRIKENIKSIEFIDGTGKYFAQGNKEFIGMEGCGAIFLRAKIKIRPKQVRTSTKIAYDTVTDVLAAVSEFKEDLTVCSIEYLNPRISDMCGLPNKHHLFVEYEGEKGEYINEEANQKLWAIRENAWDTATKNGYPIIEDCQAEAEALYDILSWLEDTDLPAAGHIGQGIIHPFFEKDGRTDFGEVLDAIGASRAGQFGYGLRKRAYVPDDVKRSITKLRDEYDHQNIINRGKLHDYV